ncbi:MAG: DNA/RNA nuclease SfsA [Chloroflexaceae bacterium]|nr:DNA/RNA nuclease SfsA [Chloroflexaceae bacterium]
MTIQISLASGAPLVEGRFIARPNQFTVDANIDGEIVRAHMADRGRLHDILFANTRLLLARRVGVGRRTDYQVVGAYVGAELVSLDTHLPNRLVAAALEAQALPQFARYTTIKPEFRLGSHRFDFLLTDDLTRCILEVKSVGQVVNGLAMFPDAPTERGRAHAEELGRLALNGQRVALLFIVQRHVARALVPNETVDPAFASALRQALMRGVEVYAYRCPITPAGITLANEIPVFGSVKAVPAYV